MVELKISKRTSYDEKKQKMEKYQRNIFGFSFQVQLFSFEYILTIILSFIFIAVIASYVASKVLEIESSKLDILRSTTIVQEYDKIGKINIVKDTHLVPVIEIKISDMDKIKKFNVFENIKSSNSQNVWDVSYKPKLEELSKYISIVINANSKENGQSQYIQRPFRMCTSKDFSDREFKMDQSQAQYLLCPDNEFLQNHWFVENGYDSKNNRKSFEILINKCSNDMQQNQCASDSDIQQLVQELVFTMYFLQRKVNFKKDVDVSPFETSFKFFQQFTLSMDDYRDNNNFIVTNKVIYNKSRHLSFSQIHKKSYDAVSKPAWYSKKPQYNTMSVSTDGVNYKTVKLQVLAGMYFFLSNEVILQERQLYNYVMFFGQLGGIFGLIISILKFIVEPVKFNFDMAKIIQILYFKKNNKKMKNNQNPFLDSLNKQTNKMKKRYKKKKSNKSAQIVEEQLQVNDQEAQKNQEKTYRSSCNQTSRVSEEGNINQVQQINNFVQIGEQNNQKDQMSNVNSQKSNRNSQNDNDNADICSANEFGQSEQQIQVMKYEQIQQTMEINVVHFSSNSIRNADKKSGEKLREQSNYISKTEHDQDNELLSEQNQQKNEDQEQQSNQMSKKGDNDSSNEIASDIPKNNVQVHPETNQLNQKSDTRVQMFKKMSQMKTRYISSDWEQKEDILEFTTMDILNDMPLAYPLFYLLKKTRFVKNYEMYNTLKRDILEKLQIQKLMKHMGRVPGLKKDVEYLMNIIKQQQSSSSSDSQDESISSRPSQV